MEKVEGRDVDLGVGARVRENGRAKEEEGVDEKVNPYPFIWADETVRPH